MGQASWHWAALQIEPAQHTGLFVSAVAAFALYVALLALLAVSWLSLAQHAVSAVASVLAEHAAAAVPGLERSEPAVLGLHAEPAWLGLQYEPALQSMHAEPAEPAWLGLQYEPALLRQHAEPAVVLSPHALLVRHGERAPALHPGRLSVHARQAAWIAAAAEGPADHDLHAAAGAQQGFLQGSAGVYPTPAVPDAVAAVPGAAVPDAAAAALAPKSSALYQPMDACFQAAQTAGLEQECCQKQDRLLPCRREHACDRSFSILPQHLPEQQLVVSVRPSAMMVAAH